MLIEIVGVQTGSLAERLGLRPGDLLEIGRKRFRVKTEKV